MILTVHSSVTVRDLNFPFTVTVGDVLRQEGRRVEISLFSKLPVGAAVSIEVDSLLLLGHVISHESGGCPKTASSCSCLVQIDQFLDLVKCSWPGWVAPHRDSSVLHSESAIAS